MSTSNERPTSLPIQPVPDNASSISNHCFTYPITPQTLEPALEIKEMEFVEDLFEDEQAPDTWVLFCPSFITIYLFSLI